MLISILAAVIRVLWISIEYPYVRRNKVRPTQNWDKHSATLWDVANAIEPVGMILGFAGIGSIDTSAPWIKSLGLTLLIAGIGIRWTAIRTLGRYFTSVVLIKNDHRLIRTGLYKHLRHPAYTGALLAHLGIGLSFCNWFTLALSSIPYFVAALYRVHVEDKVLEETFGAEYLDYCTSTKRLIPKLY